VKARAIRKRLIRGRTVSFWGRRAYFTVRVPMSAYPEPMPPAPSVPGFKDDGFGLVSDDETRRIFITEVFGASEPDASVESAHLVEPDGFGFRWWEAVEVEMVGDDVRRRDLGEELARAGRDRKRWIERWVRGHSHSTGHALPDALIEATWPAKTVYEREVPGALLLTYSVKWFYPNRKRDFCSSMARAFRVAKAAGVDMRYTEAM
jgi:hypothetical protein